MSRCNLEDIEGEWRHSSTYSQPLLQCWSGRFLKKENFLLLRDSKSGPPSAWLVRPAGKLTMPFRVNVHRRFDGPHCLHLQDRQSTAGPKYTHTHTHTAQHPRTLESSGGLSPRWSGLGPGRLHGCLRWTQEHWTDLLQVSAVSTDTVPA